MRSLHLTMLAYSRAVLASTLRLRIWIATMWVARTAMISFLLTNPIGWAILLTAALITLYFTWNRFHNLVNTTARFIWRHWAVMGLAFGPAIYAIGLLVKHMRDLVSWARSAVRWIGRIHIPGGGLLHRAGGLFGAARGLVGLASGGTVARAGAAIVGERGPELATLPAGATVTPLTGGGIGSIPRFPDEINMRVILRVDGRDLADVVFKHRLDRLARA